jgi:serine/threonine protein kinase
MRKANLLQVFVILSKLLKIILCEGRNFMFKAGRKIGPYTLIKKIGRGGFGEVWLAENQGRFATTRVALKLPLDEQVDHDLIEQEARLWAEASGHINVLPIIEASEYDGQIVIVSEYAPNGSLKQFLEKNGGKLPVKQAVEMTVGILDGLEFLHSRNIIHRDIKPDNVLLQGKTPRLTDFGISRILKTNSFSVNAVSGTPPYMSPEAFKRKRTVGTDIWSVGVVFYQLLTGGMPFEGNDIAEIYVSVKEDGPKPLPDDIPTELRRLIKKALEKNPDNRYQDANEMREALSKFLHPVIPVNPKPEHPKPIPEPLNPTQPSPEPDKPVSTIIDPFKPRPVNSEDKQKTKPLFYIIPLMAFLLFVIIGISFYFLSGNKAETSTNQIENIENIQLVPFRKGNEWGFSDVNKKLIIDAKYDEVGFFSEGLAVVRIDGKYGYIDKTDKEIIPLKYSYSSIDLPSWRTYLGSDFKDGLAIVSVGDNFGIIDKTGKKITEFKYDLIRDFSEGLASVKLDEKWGFINKTGKEVISPKYDEVGTFSEGLAPVGIDMKSGFIDKTGKEVIPFKYFYSEGLIGYKVFAEGLAVVTLYDDDEGYGYIDKTGKIVIPHKFYTAYPFSEGLALFLSRENEKYGFIDKKGNVVIPPKYELTLSSFNEGLVAVKSNGKYGYIDKTGKEITEFKYDDYSNFSEGLAYVKLNDKYGFIDKTGKEVIPFKYETADSFENGFAKVRIENWIEFYIDKNGTEYYEPSSWW